MSKRKFESFNGLEGALKFQKGFKILRKKSRHAGAVLAGGSAGALHNRQLFQKFCVFLFLVSVFDMSLVKKETIVPLKVTLGKGGFGVIEMCYLANRRNQFLAVKKPIHPNCVEIEFQALRTLANGIRHRYIAHLVAYTSIEDGSYLVFSKFPIYPIYKLKIFFLFCVSRFLLGQY